MLVCFSNFSEENERYTAQKHGLGFETGAAFQLKENTRDDLKTMCIPRAGQKDVIGRITHVS